MEINSSLYRFACWTAAAAFCLLIAGGMVTSTGSSLAVPDWPLTFGQYFPRMTGGVLFEHGHRMIAGVVAVMTWILAIWVWIKGPRGAARGLAAVAAFGILLQALLGGIAVLYRLPPAVSIAHACLGQTLFCVLLCLAQVTSPAVLSASRTQTGTSLRLWRWGALAVVALYIQLVLGAMLRHTKLGLPYHLLGAVIASGAVAFAAHKIILRDSASSLRGLSMVLFGLLAAQIILGLGALMTRAYRVPGLAAVWSTGHVVCGALLLGSAILWTLRAYRLERWKEIP